MSVEMPKSVLHKLADTIAGERPMPAPETIDHVRAAVDAFVNQKVLLERQAARIHELEVINGRLDVELETRIHDLNECRRERDHFMNYAWRLVTQMNAAEQMIRDALDMAKDAKIMIAEAAEPMQKPKLVDTITSVSVSHGGPGTETKIKFHSEPLPPMPPMPEPLANGVVREPGDAEHS